MRHSYILIIQNVFLISSTLYSMNLHYAINKKYLALPSQSVLEFINDDKPYEDTSAEYQSMAKKFQEKIGIPEKYHLSAKKIPNSLSNHDAFKNSAAFTSPDAIYINEEKLKDASFEYKHYVMYHELIHHKHTDTQKIIMYKISPVTLFFAAKIVSLFTRNPVIPKKSFIKTSLLGFALFSLSSYLTNHLYKPFMEKRADKEALHYINCFKCIQTIAEIEENESNNMKQLKQQAGYLSSQELFKQAKKLQEKNLLCSNHHNAEN